MQMKVIPGFVCVLLLSVRMLVGAPDEAVVQGLYEGTCKDAKGELKLEARVVAQGNGTYKVLVRKLSGDGKVSRVELGGSTEGEAVSFKGKDGDVEWKGAYASGSISGTCGEGCKLELKRVERLSPTLGKKPPQGAVVLLDGKPAMEEMVRAKAGAAWEFTGVYAIGEDGSIQVPKGGMSSKQQFEGSFDLHVEFMNPLMPGAHSQGRGNSGTFFPNGDEIQILDSFGECTYTGGGCGGFYRYKNPDTMDVIDSIKGENVYNLASAPPLQWQTYDIEYRVKKQDGKYVGKPRVTALQNGIKIHDNVEVNKDAKKGTFHFQDHGNPVRYRNIWVLPVADK